jgi:HD-like signal output (HDOD) protein
VSENASIVQRIQELMDSGKLSLPVFNKAAAKLHQLNESHADVDTNEVEQLVLADQVLVAEVLRAANSPFFGGLTTIHTVRSAIVRLGLRQVSHLALMASQRSAYDAKDAALRRMIHQLWMHASATAMAADWLARKLGFGKRLESESFVGGLLHDVGELVILRAMDEIKSAAKPPVDLSPALIDEILLTAHATLGSSFLKRWDIPAVYCEIAKEHHAPDFDPSKISLVTVRLANHASAKMGLSLRPTPSVILSALPEAQCINANDIVLAELEIMLEDSLAASPLT